MCVYVSHCLVDKGVTDLGVKVPFLCDETLNELHRVRDNFGLFKVIIFCNIRDCKADDIVGNIDSYAP